MEPEILTHQIIDNDQYILELCTQGTILTLKLKIKVSKRKIDVYHHVIHSIKKFDKLGDIFHTLEDFEQHIKDANNIQVVLEKKYIRILGKLQNRSLKTNLIMEVAQIPLEFLNSDEIEPCEEDIIEQILQKCSSTKQMSCEQLKQSLKEIAKVLYVCIKQKKQNQLIQQEQEERIKNLRKKVANQAQIQKRHKKEEKMSKNNFSFINFLAQLLLILVCFYSCYSFYSINNRLDQMEEGMNKLKYLELQIFELFINKQNEKVKNIFQDQQIIYYPDNDERGRLRYEGQMKDGKRDGRGILFWKEGDKYEGEFKEDIINGRGTYYWNNGDVYEGYWKNGKYEGKGVIYFGEKSKWSGDRYVGEFKNGEKEGKGIYYWKNGNRWDGQCKDGKLNGEGIYYFADGTKRMRQFKDNKSIN